MNISKRSAEWATDFRRRLKSDIFFSARVQIISFIALLTIAMTLVVTGLLEYNREVTVTGVTESLMHTITTGSVDDSIMEKATAEARGASALVLISVVLIAIVAGFITSYIALKPVRDALDRQKRFIGSIAHELRTPLAVLKTNNEVLLLENELPRDTQALLEENISDVNHITSVLNNLLLINRPDANSSISFDSVDLHTTLNTVRTRLGQLVTKKRTTISLELDTPPAVYGNEAALEQIFFNLIKNSITHSGTRDAIRIFTERISDNAVTIAIADTGVGIPRNSLPHIFEPFFRYKQSGPREQGTGLGLSIVYEIIKLHNGKITVESTSQKGTTFFVTLPRYPNAPIRKSTPGNDHTVMFDFTGRTS